MRVVVVDDNEVWRSSLVAALTSRDISVVSETREGAELLALLPRLRGEPIEVAILDLRLPPTWSDEGIQLAHRLREEIEQLGIIILSGYEHDVQLRYATRTLGDLEKRGGVGYLFKDRVTRDSLRDAVHRVASGRTVVDPIFSQQAADEYRGQRARTRDFSEREVEVLDLLVQGMTNKEIADKLYVSMPVVERHLTRIFRQLLPAEDAQLGASRKDNRRVLTVLEWLRRCGRLT